MKNIIIFLTSLCFFINSKADEGMWLPQLLKTMNEKDMQAKGLKLTAEELYSVNNSSLKDAIVSLGGFCTGEMISGEGLLLTNHHCAFGQIQDHSTINNDYLTDGFWAMSTEEELPNEGLTASFLINIKDVTIRVLSELEEEKRIFDSIVAVDNSQNTVWNRDDKLRKIFNSISKEETKDTYYNARVKSFFGGNDFYLLTYETFKDIRLVGAPPSSIGKFGGDTDNWMWPRHTGDFALFRVYCAPDGTPAEYSVENVPYEPRHHLPIQLDGVSNNDYTMVFGFPGSTDRYLTSFGIKEALEITNPTIVNIRDKKLSIMKEGMNANKKTQIQYAAKYAQTSNYWKYFIGQSKGLKRMGVYDKKVALEDSFRAWVEANSLRKEKYGEALLLIESAYNKNKEIAVNRTFLNEAVFRGPEILYFSLQTHRSIKQLPKDKKKRKEAIQTIKNDAKEFYKNYNSQIDENLLASMLELYYKSVPKDQHAPIFKLIENQLLGLKKLDFKFYAKNVFTKSVFSNKEKLFTFLETPSILSIERDPAYKIMTSIYNYYLENIYETRKEVRQQLRKGNRLFIAGLREMRANKNFYPDANSTMRVTYGQVGDYKPGDAMHYDYYTTIDGIMEKEDSTNDEFIVPAKLKELYSIGDYGRYGDKDGNLRINFISNNDITGGNSGSPVINGWGELVGTAFDGNWEAMSGDIAFENEIQRTISVDIRYILFIIDKFAGATHLIDEMTIAPKHIKKDTMIKKVNDTEKTLMKSTDVFFNGKKIPVFEGENFEVAFKKAKTQYGPSKNQLFWWKGNAYTTEQK